MLQLSGIITIFASWIRMNSRHRGERLSFDPLENLENSRVRAKRLRAASPAMAYVLLTPLWSLFRYIPARVSYYFILTYTGIPEPSS